MPRHYSSYERRHLDSRKDCQHFLTQSSRYNPLMEEHDQRVKNREMQKNVHYHIVRMQSRIV